MVHKLVDVKKDYRHNLIGEDNAYAHLMRTIMDTEVIVAITNGRLDFGPWEQIFYGEFDGQRKKRVMVKVIGNESSNIIRILPVNSLYKLYVNVFWRLKA